MKKIDAFTNLYPLSKTLRFQLIPQGKTEENFNNALILQEDEKRAADYETVKGYMDAYHKVFIDRVLKSVRLDDLGEYAALYRKEQRSPEDSANMETLADRMRKQISKAFTSDGEYTKLFGNEMIREILPAFVTEKEEQDVVNSFYQFTTYFVGFYDNRKNIYSGEGKATEVAFRLVNQNLPKFLDNVKIGLHALETLPEEDVTALACDYAELFKLDVRKLFSVEYFNAVLTQTGIDEYNQVLGGYAKKDGTKVKGLNEYINLYNQTHETRIPKLKMLYKQILSDRSTASYVQDKFGSDEELLNAILAYWLAADNETGVSPESATSRLKEIFAGIDGFDATGIYVKSGAAITELSNGAFGNWSVIQQGLNKAYDAEYMKKPPKDMEKYEEKRKAFFKKIDSHSLAELQAAGAAASELPFEGSVFRYVSEQGTALADAVTGAYSALSPLLKAPYPETKKLANDDASIEQIKAFLDALKNLQLFAKALLGSGTEERKDELFYSDFLPLCEQLDRVTPLYNKVRNYVTQKPYSDEKIKLNFGNPQFLAGWPYTMEQARSSIILRDGGKYYLGVMNPGFNSSFAAYPAPLDDSDKMEKMRYYQAADPSKDIQNLMVKNGKTVKVNGRRDAEGKNPRLEEAKNNYLPPEINRIRLSRSFSRAGECFNKDDLTAFIDYYKERTIEYFSDLTFHFKDSADYRDFSEFTSHANAQAYQLTFFPVSKKHIYHLVDIGHLYLFQLFNKDFSEFSKGTPNLHTLYFRMLFDERNLSFPQFKLNGGAEMFYRKASIKANDCVIHPAKRPIDNKNPLNEKTTSSFDYDIIKDRRYTRRQFALHLPITVNFQAAEHTKINEAVRKALRSCEDNYVIGIDRGERNLLYVCVINGKGEIVEQRSLNSIFSNGHETDYHALLDEKEKGRIKARQDWKTIGNISNVKEGYVSQAVHVICELVEKYDAVIAMEDLNSGFKNSRAKVEKSVYQKFEKMLIDKLNFYAEKKKGPDETGGLLHAYQLTEKFESFAKMGKQNGFIFYIPAWLTSKIDPTTGFVDLIKPKFESIEKTQAFIRGLDGIRYNAKEDLFEFDVDYSKFPKGSADFRGNWTLCSYGKRVLNFRNPEKNSEWDSKEICLTESFRELLAEYSVDLKKKDLKEQLAAIGEKDFYVRFMKLVGLTLQMRNSIPNSDVDYLCSPVRNESGGFFNSNEQVGPNASLPADADANGAYHIARKAQWAIEQILTAPEDKVRSVKLAISNQEWLAYAQKPFC